MFLDNFRTILRPTILLLLPTPVVTKLYSRTIWRSHKWISQIVRYKYTQHKGVKGIKNKKFSLDTKVTEKEENVYIEQEMENINIYDREYDKMVDYTMHISRKPNSAHNVLLIQPYVKWRAIRTIEITPDDQLKEAEALVNSIPNWNVCLSLKVPLESMDRTMLFGSGKLEELKELVEQLRKPQAKNQSPLTCLFVSKSCLSFGQKRFLETEFNLPIMDRYSVVIQILRLHASSTEARLQVAMAEIPYIWAQVKDANLSIGRKQGYSLTDTQRNLLKYREKKLKMELDRIRSHRKLLRNRRKQKNYPIVAVVGYTNAGKTSLIKSLTNEDTMNPRDQLFATLDVTAHAGTLPCNLEVIYLDTVGFMSDLPTGLFECFVATLEDAMLADVIIHVQDISHNCHQMQKRHVESTLKSLNPNVITASCTEKQNAPLIINVGNKCDLLLDTQLQPKEDTIRLVSAKHQTGLHDLLLDIEKHIMIATGRKQVSIRVPNGGAEMTWLYKNAAIVDMNADTSNAEMLLMVVVISDLAMKQFKQTFVW